MIILSSFYVTNITAKVWKCKLVEKGYVFEDDLGRQVEVHAVENTAALLGSFADVWDLADKLLNVNSNKKNNCFNRLS